MSIIKDTIGLPPSGMDIPTFPIPWRTVLFQVLPSEFGKELKKSKLKKSAPAYLAVVSERLSPIPKLLEVGYQQLEKDLIVWGVPKW